MPEDKRVTCPLFSPGFDLSYLWLDALVPLFIPLHACTQHPPSARRSYTGIQHCWYISRKVQRGKYMYRQPWPEGALYSSP